MIKLVAVLALFGSHIAVAQVQLPWDEALVKAQVEGKYRMLLKQIAVPEDAAGHGEFNDFGSWFGTSWAGYSELPQGFWVYVYPCWYIWGELSATPIQKRPWGPEQATGEPESKGVSPESAWVAASRDRPEWLLVEFDSPLQITEVILHDARACPVSYKLRGFTTAGTVGSKMTVCSRAACLGHSHGVRTAVEAPATEDRDRERESGVEGDRRCRGRGRCRRRPLGAICAREQLAGTGGSRRS